MPGHSRYTPPPRPRPRCWPRQWRRGRCPPPSPPFLPGRLADCVPLKPCGLARKHRGARELDATALVDALGRESLLIGFVVERREGLDVGKHAVKARRAADQRASLGAVTVHDRLHGPRLEVAHPAAILAVADLVEQRPATAGVVLEGPLRALDGAPPILPGPLHVLGPVLRCGVAVFLVEGGQRRPQRLLMRLQGRDLCFQPSDLGCHVLLVLAHDGVLLFVAPLAAKLGQLVGLGRHARPPYSAATRCFFSSISARSAATRGARSSTSRWSASR